MVIQLGVTVYIDGEKFKCTSFSRLLDSDFGSGPVVERAIAIFEDQYGIKRTISMEVEA